MSTLDKVLNINSRTTGFALPGESYVDKRLDLNELIIDDVHTTFYFRYLGPNTLGVKKNDVLVIDKSEVPKNGDLVILTDKTFFKIREYNGQDNLWGKVTWVLSKL